MEAGSNIPFSFFGQSELTEVLGSFGNYIVVELEDDAACTLAADFNIKLGVYQIPIAAQRWRSSLAIQQGIGTYKNVSHSLSAVCKWM